MAEHEPQRNQLVPEANSQRSSNAAVSGIGAFVAAHPRWTVVILLVLSSFLSPISATLAAAVWVVTSVAAIIWRETSLKSRYQSAAARREVVLQAPSARLRVPVTDSGVSDPERLRRAAVQLTVVDLGLPLDEQIEIAGEQHHIKEIRAVVTASGRSITARGVTLESVQIMLCPEPWNQYDPNAVAVMAGVLHVGYLPREIAAEYAPALLRLAQTGQAVGGVARIWARTDGSAARARVTVLAPEAEQLPA